MTSVTPSSPDALTPDEFNAAVTAITSAFGDSTRREIYLFARDHEAGVTAAMVAEKFDLHANVARHHLDKLAAGGYLTVDLVRSSSGAGRPSKAYVCSAERADIRFPVRRDDLLGALLGKALTLLPADQAERLAEEVGIDYGRALAASMEPGNAHRSMRAAAAAVADALTSHGFAARAETIGDALQIVSEHCPFGNAAIEHPVICAIDRGLVKGMLAGLHGDGSAEMIESRPAGDDHCITGLIDV